jgi:cytochrome P450
MTKKGTVTSTITPSLILGNIIELLAADLEQWKALLDDPLTVSPAIVQHLLRLRDSTSISPRKNNPEPYSISELFN